MKILKGEFTNARIYAKDLEEKAEKQVQEMCNSSLMKGSKIAIMPDAHWGHGVPIGTTIALKNYIFPDYVGVDIGCGVSAHKIKAVDGFNFEKLQRTIDKHIPSGRNVRLNSTVYADIFAEVFDGLYAKNYVNIQRAKQSIGTLGGGNHFISLERSDSDPEDEAYLLVHTGSRKLGYEIAQYYSKLAEEELRVMNIEKKQKIIDYCKANGLENQIEDRLKVFKENMQETTSFLSDIHRTQYINDMLIAVNYAQLNREIIIEEICGHMGYKKKERIDTIHNYIDRDFILRKGAVSAHKGKKFILPINMMTGSLICEGKGNPDWNFSAPHGAGRLMSRTDAKKNLDVDLFEEQMSGIWSKSIGKDYIDEAPHAYKSLSTILENLSETAEVKKTLTPIFNFKAKQ